MFYRVTAQPTRLRQEGNLIGRSQLDKRHCSPGGGPEYFHANL
jgi:hypothetical protein